MEKTYHFMAGLPRSGSTVLSALLNQHPDIYASPQTDLISLLYEAHTRVETYESYKAGLFHEGYNAVLEGMPTAFYGSINKPFIIDKNRGWGTPYNWDNLRPYMNPEGKIILTMRPILEVLASFMKVIKNNEALFEGDLYLNEDFWVSSYRNSADAKIENIMQLNGEMDRAIFSIANLLKNHRDKVQVVWFDELLTSPQQTLDKIYNFLEIESFKNNFNLIEEVDSHNDLNGYGLLGLHDVATKLQKPKTKPEDYLSEYVIKKYENALDFLEL